MKRKTIAVMGATGAQGGGLARAILDDPTGRYAVRALTRNPDSPAAQALAARGAELVRTDLSDAGSLERAFEGAYGAFCITFFWDHFSPERELDEAWRMARAAKAAGVSHVIWSTLENTRDYIGLEDLRMPTLLGRYKVPHFDAKGEANAFFLDAGVPTTFLLTSFYWDNFIHFGMGPQRMGDGRLALTLPMGDRPLPCIAAEDIGRCAFGIFEQGDAAVGGTIGVAGQHLTGDEMAATLSDALGEPVLYNAVDPDAYRNFGFPGADELGNMFQFKHDFNDEFCRVRDVERSRELNRRLQSFSDWLATHRDALRIPVLA